MSSGILRRLGRRIIQAWVFNLGNTDPTAIDLRLIRFVCLPNGRLVGLRSLEKLLWPTPLERHKAGECSITGFLAREERLLKVIRRDHRTVIELGIGHRCGHPLQMQTRSPYLGALVQ